MAYPSRHARVKTARGRGTKDIKGTPAPFVAKGRKVLGRATAATTPTPRKKLPTTPNVGRYGKGSPTAPSTPGTGRYTSKPLQGFGSTPPSTSPSGATRTIGLGRMQSPGQPRPTGTISTTPTPRKAPPGTTPTPRKRTGGPQPASAAFANASPRARFKRSSTSG